MPSFGRGSYPAPKKGSTAKKGPSRGEAAAANSRNLIVQVHSEFGADFVESSSAQYAHMDDRSITHSTILRVPVGVRGVDVVQQALSSHFLDSWRVKRHALFTKRAGEASQGGAAHTESNSEVSIRASRSEGDSTDAASAGFADIVRLVIDCELERPLYDRGPHTASAVPSGASVRRYLRSPDADEGTSPSAEADDGILKTEDLLDSLRTAPRDWETADVVSQVLLRNFADLLVITRPDVSNVADGGASVGSNETNQRNATIRASLKTSSSSLNSIVQLVSGQCSGLVEVRVLSEVESIYSDWVRKQSILAQLTGPGGAEDSDSEQSQSAAGNLSVTSSPNTSPLQASRDKGNQRSGSGKPATSLAPPQEYPLKWFSILDSVIKRVIKAAQLCGTAVSTDLVNTLVAGSDGAAAAEYNSADTNEFSHRTVMSEIVPLRSANDSPLTDVGDTDVVTSSQVAFIRGLTLEFLLHYLTCLPSRYVEDYSLFACAPDGTVLPNHVEIAKEFIVPNIIHEEHQDVDISVDHILSNDGSATNRSGILKGFERAIEDEAKRNALVKYISRSLVRREVSPAEEILSHHAVSFPYTFRLVFTPRRSVTGGITKASKRMEDGTMFGLRFTNLLPESLIPPPPDPFAPSLLVSSKQAQLDKFRVALKAELRGEWMARGDRSVTTAIARHPTTSIVVPALEDPRAIRSKSSATTDTTISVFNSIVGGINGEDDAETPHSFSVTPKSAALAATLSMRPKKSAGLVDDEIAATKSAHLLSFLPRLVVPTAFLRLRRQEALAKLARILEAEAGDEGIRSMSESTLIGHQLEATVPVGSPLTLRRRAAKHLRAHQLKKHRSMFGDASRDETSIDTDVYWNQDYPDRPQRSPYPRAHEAAARQPYNGEEGDLASLDVFLDDLMEDAGITMYDLARFGGNHSSVAAITREAKRFCREEAPKMIQEDRILLRESNIARQMERRERNEQLRLQETTVRLTSLREEKLNAERTQREAEMKTELNRAEEKHAYLLEAQRRKMTEEEKKQQHENELQKRREEDKRRKEELSRDVEKRLRTKELQRTIENARTTDGFNPDNTLSMYVMNNLRPELRKLNAAERQALISEDLSGQLDRSVQAAKEFQTGIAEGSKDSRTRVRQYIVEESFTQQIERASQDRKRNERRAARAREVLSKRTFPLSIASEIRPYAPTD